MVRVRFNLPERARNILLAPRREWPVIEREFTEPAFLFARYVAVLALIPALAGFIGSSLVGVKVSAGTFREPLVSGFASAAIGYLLSFVIVYVTALVIDSLAPRFDGRRNFMQALKLSAYAHTPVWLAGIFLVVPGLRFLTVLSFYGGYLLWTGLPVLMGVPRSRALLLAAAIVIVTVIATVSLAIVTHFVFSMSRGI